MLDYTFHFQVTSA